jgi:hypothetical protein
MTGSSINAPRNIGFTKFTKDLSTKLSEGEKETSGYYSFHGAWVEMENEGISWLTNFESMRDSVSRLKIMKISSDYILLLFEIWDPKEYVKTAYMIVDKGGKPYGDGEVKDLCYTLRLLKADDPIIISDGEILLLNGRGDDASLSTFKISVKF